MYEVYVITNLITGLQYVGLTRQGLADRWAKHKSKHNRSELKLAITEYGAENFRIDCLERHDDLLDAMIAELRWIKWKDCNYPNGYNNLYTESSCKKISKTQDAKPKSKEHRLAVSIGLTGLKQSAETVQKRIDHFYTSIKDQNGRVYASVKEASQQLGIPLPSISHLLVGRVRNPRHGYHFTYVENKQ
jgi:group I intron endonuclease